MNRRHPIRLRRPAGGSSAAQSVSNRSTKTASAHIFSVKEKIYIQMKQKHINVVDNYLLKSCSWKIPIIILIVF